MTYADPMHLARLAALEGALCSLLRAAQDDDSGDAPDRVTADMGPDGLDVTYWRHGVPVGGEGV